MFNLQVFTGLADNPEDAAQIATEKARAFLEPRQWKLPDGRSAYEIKIAFHEGGHGCLCAITVLGPQNQG